MDKLTKAYLWVLARRERTWVSHFLITAFVCYFSLLAGAFVAAVYTGRELGQRDMKKQLHLPVDDVDHVMDAVSAWLAPMLTSAFFNWQ